MSLFEVVKSLLLKEVIKSESRDKLGDNKNETLLNKILLVDPTSLLFLKKLLKSSELTSRGFITIQDIKVSLQPIAIHLTYLCEPSEENMQLIVKHFSDPVCKFLSANIYTIGKLSDHALSIIKSNSVLTQRIGLLKELPLTFFIEGLELFTLGPSMIFPNIYSKSEQDAVVKQMSDRIIDLMTVMNDNPCVRYLSSGQLSEKLANRLHQSLNEIAEKCPKFGKSGSETKQSMIVILDRTFDPRPPFLHDTTVEPMARDILDVVNDTIEFKEGKNTLKLIFDEEDPTWQALRFKHIAVASEEINSKIKEIMASKKMPSDKKVTVADLQKMMSKLPARRAEFTKCQSLLMLAHSLMQKYSDNNLKEVSRVEQDLATNENPQGEAVSDNPALYINLIDDAKLTLDKLRLIALFAMKNNVGVTKACLDKLLKSSNMESFKQSLMVLDGLNFPIIEGSSPKTSRPLDRCPFDSQVATGFDDSRYIPILWSILKMAANQELSDSKFPTIGEKIRFTVSNDAPSKAFEFGKYGRKTATASQKNKPRIYIFIIGGIFYSELRILHQAQTNFPNFNFSIGSTEVLTPITFINHLKSM